MRPCCKFKGSFGSLDQASLQDILRGSKRQDLQEAMVRGLWVSGCRGCQKIEERGGQSLRQDMRRRMTVTERITSLEIRLNNQCNLACRYCGSEYSSKWQKLMASQPQLKKIIDETRGESRPGKYKVSTADLVKFICQGGHDLKLITFTGGEPLLQKEHYTFLEAIKNVGQSITLDYTTNLSHLSVSIDKLSRLWSHFAGVTLRVSIDGDKDVYQYVRSHGKLDAVFDNIKLLKRALPKDFLRLSGTFTCSIYNITRMVECIRLYNRLGLYFHSTLVQWPVFLRASEIPLKLKPKIEKSWEEFLCGIEEDHSWQSDFLWGDMTKRENIAQIKRFGQSCIEYMKGPHVKGEAAKFQKFTKALDRFYGTDFNQVYPEFRAQALCDAVDFNFKYN